MTVLVSGASMFAMAKILHLLLGWNMNVSIWVSSLTVAVYVTLGGLISAVFNEVLQFFLIWFGSLLIPILGLIHAGGWTKMMATIQENVQGHPSRPCRTPTSPACGATSARSTPTRWASTGSAWSSAWAWRSASATGVPTSSRCSA